MSDKMEIVDAFLNGRDVGQSDIYYKLKTDWHSTSNGYNNIGILSDYYCNGERTLIIMYDDDADYMYSVIEYNARMVFVASESFKSYKEAKRFFKNIV